MTGGFQPYPECKDSGDSWLGQVPSHWRVVPVGAISLRRSDRNRPELPLLSVLREKGVVLRSSLAEDENHNFIPDDLSNYRVALAGNLVVNKMKAWQGSVGIAPIDGIVSPAYFIFELSKITDGFAHRLLRSRIYADYFARASDGVRIGQWDLNIDRMKRIPVVIPPRPEQEAIVRFLMELDRKVNRFIRNRRRLIEVLNEQKQAIIHRAVTRGLDESAPLKPSGVDWLGEIPEHWEIRRVRTLVRQIDQGVSPQAENRNAEGDSWGVLKAGCVNRGVFRPEQHKRLADGHEFDRALAVKAGDVLVSRACGSPDLVGSVGLVTPSPFRLILSDKTFRLCFAEPESVEFYVRAMNALVFRRQVRLAISGAEGLANNLPLSALRDFVLPSPPPNEAVMIGQRLHAETARIDGAMHIAEREIALIREYRTRLIADVVTGKVDVRHLAPAETQASPKANIYFRRSVFAAEIVHRLHDEPTFGHVKFEKTIFVCEKRCGVDTGSTYRRKAAGPYDNRALRSIDSQMKKRNWYAVEKRENRYRYVPMERAGQHRVYFDRYFRTIAERFSEVIELFRPLKTQQCEIVATLYSAWDDLLAKGDASDDQIIEQVLHHWHPSKKSIEEDRWRRALGWMKRKGLTPERSDGEA